MSTVFLRSKLRRTCNRFDIKYFSTISKYDTTIIGGGIVGMAVARELQLNYPSMKIAVLEKESEIGYHQTGHNSGVIHCGIYYKPNSLKAKLCVNGVELMYDYLKKNKIEYKKTGKLIVAVEKEEIPRLQKLYENGLINKVPELKYLHNNKEIKEIEPLCNGLSAIYCGSTGIVNWKIVAENFSNDFINLGGKIYLKHKVINFTNINEEYRKGISDKNFNNGIRIKCENKNDILTENIITCCGIFSDEISLLSNNNKLPKMIPLRGEYLILKNESKINKELNINIYPVPLPNVPYLGVHFTPRINNTLILGPTTILAYDKEGYKFNNFNIKFLYEILTFKGFWKMFFKHKNEGFNQLYRNIFWKKQIEQLQRYIPSLNVNDIDTNIFMSGIRAQAMDNNGQFIDDFVFDTSKCRRFLHVRNAPSPAATSSLAIAKAIVDKAKQELTFNFNCN